MGGLGILTRLRLWSPILRSYSRCIRSKALFSNRNGGLCHFQHHLRGHEGEYPYVEEADRQTYIPLCILRALAGLGMALAGPSGFGIVGAYVVHEPVRTIVFAAFGLGGPIGAATGTLLGGAVAAINA
jgi:MFS family permease